MAEYRQPNPAETLGPGYKDLTRNSSIVKDVLAKSPDVSAGQEAALLNGLLVMGYDPKLLTTFADADPNRRYLDDAITRALRAGVPEGDIIRALIGMRAAATGDPEGAIEAFGVKREDLPPEGVTAFDAIVNRAPLPYLDRGQPGGVYAPGAPPPPTPTTAPAPAKVLPGDVRAIDQTYATPPPPKPTEPLRQPTAPTGTLGGGRQTTTTRPQTSPGIANLPSLPPNASDAEVEAYIRKHYGYSAWVLDVPELRQFMLDLGREFAGTDVDEARIEGALSGTEWWKTHSEPQRLAIEERLTDPATYNENVNGKFDQLQVLLGTLGFTIPEGRLREIAATAYELNWSTPQMRTALAAEFDYDPETGAQESSKIVGDLRSEASQYLVPLAEDTIDTWGRQIAAGSTTIEGFQGYLREQAKSMFPSLTAALDAGITVRQYADPYVQIAARELEIPTGQVDLMDPKFMKALTQVDPKTGARTSMSLSDWGVLLRSDPTYGYEKTSGARKQAAEFTDLIAKTWGVM